MPEVELEITAHTDQAVAGLEEVTAAAHRAEQALAALPVDVRGPRVSILREPLTYEAKLVRSGDPEDPRGLRAISKDRHSYVKDLAASQTKTGDWRGAEERLERHAKEMESLGEQRERLFHPDVEVEFEQRAVNWGSGQGGYFAPPLWLTEQFAMIPTPERSLSVKAPRFELPVGAQSVNLPRWTQGPEMGLTQVGSPPPTQTSADAPVSSPVATIAGNWDVPVQMLEQSPVGAHLDWVAFTSMEARYGYALERQMIEGTGVVTPQGSGNNELVGILNNPDVPAANKVTYTDASPTPGRMIESATGTGGGGLAQVIAAIGNNRLAPPDMWMMRTARAAWMLSGAITFPVALADQPEPGVFDLLAFPVRHNNAIGTSYGTGGEDRIIAVLSRDWLVLESEPRTAVYTENLSGALMVRLQYRRYVATLLRYPSSVAWLQGTGMTVQPNF